MADLIERKAAIEYFMTNTVWHDEDGYEIHDAEDKRALLKSYFDGIPPAQQEHKVGKWLSRENEPKHQTWWTCSRCTGIFDYKWNYCPNCGAKMEE